MQNSLYTYQGKTQNALDEILSLLNWEEGGVEAYRFYGDSPRLATPHPLGPVAAAAIAGAATGAARRWHQATGQSQTIGVNLLQAVCALHPGYFQRQQGYKLSSSSLGRELKAAFYPTSDDKWFYPVGSYPHLRDGILSLLDCANNPDALARAIGRWKADDLEGAFLQHKLPGVYARTPCEWRTHEQGQQIANTPFIEITRIGEGPSIAPNPRQRPLDDIRVVDFGHVIAGPAAARTLAEHGANVLRLSSPNQPDPVNQVLDTSQGQRNAFLDFQQPGDIEKLRNLSRQADVFIQSWRVGSLEARGLGPEDLAKLRPGIIYVSVSAFGLTGVWNKRKGFDQLAQVATGIAHTEGISKGGKPHLVPTYLLNDYLTAYLAAAGIFAALEKRATDGGSYHVSVSLARTSMWVQEQGLLVLPQDPQNLSDLNPILRSRSTAYGRLDQMDPVAELSSTPAYWSINSAPLGSSVAQWLP